MGLGDHSQNPASDRVLVVDSDAAARAATVRLLERRGYDVVPAGTPGEIESALDENRPRVVVIEPALDGVDGFDLCRDILAAYAGDRPVMVLASHRLHGRAAQLRAKEAGAYLYVERPQQDKVLIDAVALAFADLVPEHGATLPSEIAPEAGGLEVEVAGGRAEVPTSDTPAVSDPEREERDLLDVATRMSSARFDEPPPQQASEVDLLEADPMELENWIDDAFSDFDDRSAPDSAPAAAPGWRPAVDRASPSTGGAGEGSTTYEEPGVVPLSTLEERALDEAGPELPPSRDDMTLDRVTAALAALAGESSDETGGPAAPSASAAAPTEPCLPEEPETTAAPHERVDPDEPTDEPSTTKALHPAEAEHPIASSDLPPADMLDWEGESAAVEVPSAPGDSADASEWFSSPDIGPSSEPDLAEERAPAAPVARRERPVHQRATRFSAIPIIVGTLIGVSLIAAVLIGLERFGGGPAPSTADVVPEPAAVGLSRDAGSRVDSPAAAEPGGAPEERARVGQSRTPRATPAPPTVPDEEAVTGRAGSGAPPPPRSEVLPQPPTVTRAPFETQAARTSNPSSPVTTAKPLPSGDPPAVPPASDMELAGAGSADDPAAWQRGTDASPASGVDGADTDSPAMVAPAATTTITAPERAGSSDAEASPEKPLVPGDIQAGVMGAAKANDAGPAEHGPTIPPNGPERSASAPAAETESTSGRTTETLEPVEPRRVTITPPRLLRSSRVKPRYPMAARHMNVGGTVVLRAIVAADGSVADIDVITEPQGNFGLGKAAAEAVSRWRYRPATREGEPVEHPIKIRIVFDP